MVLRMENPEAEPKLPQKRKRESKPLPVANNIKSAIDNTQAKKFNNEEIKSAPPVLRKHAIGLETILEVKDKLQLKDEIELVDKDISNKYPILKNKELVQKFLSVPMNNNQKGRIRQLLRDQLKGTSEFLLPDVIHNRIQTIIKSSGSNLSETDLRKIRILYNMLKTALAAQKSTNDFPKNKKKKLIKKQDKTEDTLVANDGKVVEKEINTNKANVIKIVQKKNPKVKNENDKVAKVKGPKRYVVFLGNLPIDIDKEKIMDHFKEFNECIVDIRIPKHAEGKKSSIAYVELTNEPSYELALSKHHSMLGSKRINVLYTTQKQGKVSKTEAKSKSAKLIALQKAGKLIGSVPVNRKRSHRRMKMKKALAKQAAEAHETFFSSV